MSEKKSEQRQEVDYETILLEIGTFGKFQWLQCFWIFWPILVTPIYMSQYVFNAGEADYRCKVPQCESSPPEFPVGEWGAWTLLGIGNKCEMYRPVEAMTGCSVAAFFTNETQSCDAWVYDHNNTIVPEFNLACQEWKRTFVGTVHNVGMLVAMPIVGYVCDIYGRRVTFIVPAVSGAVMGVIRSFSNTYIMYVLLEFLEALVSSGVYNTGFILIVELMDLKHRVLGGNMISIAFALGQIVMALAAWAIPYWRDLTRVLYAPSFLFIFYYFFIEESVRWLLMQNRKKEAATIIFKAAKMNSKKLSSETVQYLSDESVVDVRVQIETAHSEQKQNETGQHSLVKQVLRSKVMVFRVCICAFCWMTVTFIYFGISINSVSLNGNPYVNYSLTSLVEIPGYCLNVLILNRFGRKCSIITPLLICGVSLLTFPFLPPSLQWLQTTLNMVGKLTISMVYSSIYVYTSELFPTSLRHTLLSICGIAGGIGSILTPQTPLMTEYMESLPYLVFGALAGFSGLLMMLTPETLNIRLPDTIEQAEGITAAPHVDHRIND